MRLGVVKRFAVDLGSTLFGGKSLGVATGLAAHKERDLLQFFGGLVGPDGLAFAGAGFGNRDVGLWRGFDACRWRNVNHRDWMLGPKGAVIPPRVIEKPPSAELREDQKDEDSLPPYEVLDGILRMLVDQEASVAECVASGYDRDMVKKVEHLIYISEYKRFQSAPGPRLSHRAFWLDRRYPIVNRWRDGS